ncbi:MAG: hypothetical protein ACI9UV_000027 [Algoriphagus sp.]
MISPYNRITNSTSIMKNFSTKITTIILGGLTLISCSTNKLAVNDSQDNLYFMASDAKIATQYAVQNNNPEEFETLSTLNSNAFEQENFSSRNVNPDYIARYQTDSIEGVDEVVYFDEAIDENGQSTGNIDAYNNFRVSGSGNSNMINPAMSFNMGLGMGMMSPYGMGMGMMRPFGMGMMNPYGMGGFYDPFYSPWGFRPGFNLSLGFGFGNLYNPFWGPNLGYGLGNSMFGGYPGFGYPAYGGRPIYVLPGGEYGDRRVVRGARPTRGSSLTTASMNPSNAAIQPSTARAQARQDVLNSRSGGRTNVINSGSNARVSTRDFSSSQNDYYSNSRSRNTMNQSTRNSASPAMNRSVTRSSGSAMPSARPSAIPSNSRSYSGPSRSDYNRSSNSYTNSRAVSPSYNRSTSPGRGGNSGYTNGGTNSRTYSTPSRSNNTPSYSTPSRSSSGGVSTGGGGASRSSGSTGGASSGGSRGGRGN